MANTCESLINVVIDNKPKMLRGLPKKGNVVGLGGKSSPDADKKTTGGEAEPNPYQVQLWNVVNRICTWTPGRYIVRCDRKHSRYRRREEANAAL
jgi:hypothetical protein